MHRSIFVCLIHMLSLSVLEIPLETFLRINFMLYADTHTYTRARVRRLLSVLQ